MAAAETSVWEDACVSGPCGWRAVMSSGEGQLGQRERG